MESYLPLLELFRKSLQLQQIAFRKLEAIVPVPKVVITPEGWMHRYQEKSIQQAIVAKLARTQSMLAASLLLLQSGFIQELGVIQRCIDDSLQDVDFLVQAIRTGELKKIHNEYLAWFWHDIVLELPNTDKGKYPGEVPRKKIYAYLVDQSQVAIDPHTGITALKALMRNYSAFVHGSIASIMELFEEKTNRFNVSGLLGSARISESENDLWNYFFRSAITVAHVGHAFGRRDIFDGMYRHKNELAKAVGKSDLITP